MSPEMLLREVIDIPESVHSGDFKIELSGGFTEVDQRIAEYVVTDQLRGAFRKALALVRSAVRDGKSHAAYLHGSFGSGKSHFLTVLHAVLNNEPAARAKPALHPVIREHDDWLGGKKFLMVPYHLVGQADVSSAVLGGYVSTVKALHPDKPTPAVYRADSLLDDARGQREFFGDDVEFVRWLTHETGAAASAPGVPDDLTPLGSDGGAVGGWTTSALDEAFSAQAGDPRRDALISALLSGPNASYARGATGDAAAFLPLENGLAAITRHAKSLGYDGLILFLDELILWLQSNMANQQFVNTQVGILVKLIESGDATRELPIVSFISRQRDLSKLIGEDVTGSDVKNLEAQVNYLAERFDIITLEDRNLPAIIKERILKVKPGPGQAALDEAFKALESTNAATRDVLLDANGATEATWDEFKEVYPLSPALLNVLVVLSNALQRERTGLRLLQEMLKRRRNDLKVGELLPLGDLWDVLVDGTGDAFTERLRRESAAAQRFHARARALLLDKYGAETNERFIADDRLVKTLLLSALAPEVPALTRLTGARLAALNHGSIRSRINSPGKIVVQRLREMQAELGELRAEGTEDPVFTLHLSDLDIDPLLDAVGEQDNRGARRRWIKDHLWKAFGVTDGGEFVCERDVVWRGSKRTVELVFANVRDHEDLRADQFEPSLAGRARIIVDYPFDDRDHSPRDDAYRVHEIAAKVAAPTAVWLPHFFSEAKGRQLGKLIKIKYLLTRERLVEYTPQLTDDARAQMRQQLQVQQSTLASQVEASLMQLYGLASPDATTVGTEVSSEGHILTLMPGLSPRLHGGASWETNLQGLVDALFGRLYPKHPDLGVAGTRKALTLGELRTVLQCITRAMENRDRRVELERAQLPLMRRVIHGLDLGEVSDGPLVISPEWRRKIEQHAAQHQFSGDFEVDDVRRWIGELGGEGLDPLVVNLIIQTYALLADRAWLFRGMVEAEAPALDKMGSGWRLREPDLPTEAEFAAARRQAGEMFGVHVPEVLFTRNVERLSAGVLTEVEKWEAPLTRMREVCASHAKDLGIDVDASARGRANREAAEFLASLRQAPSATERVRILAAPIPAGPITVDVLAYTAKHAVEVSQALDSMSWSHLNTIRNIVERNDQAGMAARSILERLSREAALNELERPLAPVLTAVARESWSLIQSLIEVPTPPPPPEITIKLPVDTNPPVSTQPALPDRVGPANQPGRRARVSASAVEATLETLLVLMREDVRTHLKQNPLKDIDVSWHLSTPTDQDG